MTPNYETLELLIGRKNGDGYPITVILENDAGQARFVTEHVFRTLFDTSQETRLAVLNSCQSATRSNSELLAGLAPRLLQRKLSASAWMTFNIWMKIPIGEDLSRSYKQLGLIPKGV